ncbi:heme-binding protein [Hydrogenophaga sp.]|uniref:GlcG/HbpS family heme-binding protein n=1 Tax=Hydrogenophaga sp. TaxID=1904254 RepID=UPI003568E8AB
MNTSFKAGAIALLLASPLLATQAQAQAVLTEKTLSAALATQIATATVAACSAKGYSVAATVVDRSGTVRAVVRADNAGPHTLEASRLKAFTSASARNTTLAMMEGSQKNPGAANLGQIPGFLLLGGGVPVKVGNEVVGALGVGGAPGGHLDEQCAVAALEQFQDQLK